MSLSLSKLKIKAESPDSDGDRWIEGKVKLGVEGEQGGTLLRLLLVVSDPQGRPMVVEEERREEPLDPGDTEKVEFSAMARAPMADAQAELRAELLDAHSVDLGTHEVSGLSSVLGSGEPVALSRGVVLRSWSVVVAGKDSDGDARFTLMALVENQGDQAVAEVQVATQLLKPKGGELESSDDELRGLLPGQTVCVEAGTYTKAKWFKKGVKVRGSVTVRWVVATGVSERVAVKGA